jgi:hypothetical protein
MTASASFVLAWVLKVDMSKTQQMNFDIPQSVIAELGCDGHDSRCASRRHDREGRRNGAVYPRTHGERWQSMARSHRA